MYIFTSNTQVSWLCFSLSFKSLQQTVLSHEPSVKSVREKGEALLDLVQDVTLKDKIDKLQSDYQDLCSAGKVRRHWEFNQNVFICPKGALTSFSLSEDLKG